MPVRWYPALLLLWPLCGWAQATHYAGPAPRQAVTPLVARFDQLVATLATRGGHPPVRPDARLDAAATTLLRLWPKEGVPPNELVESALWLEGLVEPPPHLVLASLAKGGEAALWHELERQLVTVLAEGRYVRLGVGLLPSGTETRVLLALQESALELSPIARTQPLGASVTLRGRLVDGLLHPEAFVTVPDGRQVNRVPLGHHARSFTGSFHCGPKRGLYQVELTGEGRFGAKVVANFPVACGVAAPTAVRSVSAEEEEGFEPPAAAEQTIFRLLNADRARAGLPPLGWSDRLAEVARGHSADMAGHGFFGHRSPTTGTAADRARRAHLDAMLILENVARAPTPREAERGLMNSPGHRANILSPEATEVGVGVVLSPERALLVTQLFARPPERYDAHTVDELRGEVVALRRSRHVAPLTRSARLDQLAQAAALNLAARRLSTQKAGKQIGAALAKAPFDAVRCLFAVASSATQLVDSLGDKLADPAVTVAGLGVAPGQRPEGGSALFVVIVLATAR